VAKTTYVAAGQAAHDAGFRGNDIVIAVSVGFAESSPPGELTSVGDGGNSYGLMQIHWPSWGTRLRQNGIASSPESLKQLGPAMKAAKYVHDHGSRGWGEWTQYRNGAYKKYEDDVKKAILEKSDEEITESRDLPNPLAGIERAITTVVGVVVDGAQWIGNPDNWVRIVMVVGGTLVGLAGASMILKETDSGKAIVKGVTKGAL
jgi:Lysozyme like domain